MTDLAWIDAALRAARPQALAALLRWSAISTRPRRRTRRRASARSRSGPPAWLVFVARNAGLDGVRRRTRARAAVEPGDDHRGPRAPRHRDRGDARAGEATLERLTADAARRDLVLVEVDGLARVRGIEVVRDRQGPAAALVLRAGLAHLAEPAGVAAEVRLAARDVDAPCRCGSHRPSARGAARSASGIAAPPLPPLVLVGPPQSPTHAPASSARVDEHAATKTTRPMPQTTVSSITACLHVRTSLRALRIARQQRTAANHRVLARPGASGASSGARTASFSADRRGPPRARGGGRDRARSSSGSRRVRARRAPRRCVRASRACPPARWGGTDSSRATART